MSGRWIYRIDGVDNFDPPRMLAEQETKLYNNLFLLILRIHVYRPGARADIFQNKPST